MNIETQISILGILATTWVAVYTILLSPAIHSGVSLLPIGEYVNLVWEKE